MTLPVAPRSLGAALAHIRLGGRLIVPTYTRCTVIDKRTLARFEAAGTWLLCEDNDGYRLNRRGGSIYILPGQLRYA